MNDLEKKTETTPEATIQPACSICEEDGEVRLNVEMPGVEKSGIEVSMDKNELVILGKRSDTVPEGTYLIRERREGAYRKRFIIDDTIDRDKIEAVMENGVLTLKLTTKEAAKPKKIEIK